MKKYTFFLLLLVFCVIFLCGCVSRKKELTDLDVIKNRGYLIVGVKGDSPPFGYYKDSKLTGIDIIIARAIADNIFKNDSLGSIKFVVVNPQNRISKLNSKEVDILVATMSVNDKRKLILDFSVPYFVTNQKIMVRKTSKITGLQYFNKNGRLAVVMGTTGEKISRHVVPNAYIIGAKNYTEAIKMLEENQVDAILGDDCILSGLNNNKFKIINRAYSKEYYAAAVRKTDKSKELLNVANIAIAEILDDKKLKLVKNYHNIK